MQNILLALKHGGWTELAPWLGQRMARAAREFWGDGVHQGVAAVPLHWRRRRRRGYDQAALLARAMAGASGLPVLDVLRRTRATLPQEGGIEARKANVHQVFRVRRPERVRDRSILLVDDVATTGATIEACAHVLRAAGAVRIDALTAARAVLQV